MAQKSILEAKGLYTDPNLLSKVPSGAMVVADNVIIDRDGIIEPRRGFNQYGNTFGIGTDRSKQLLSYKNRILLHYNDKLLFNNNPHNLVDDGDFQEFSGTFLETEAGLRIKGAEANKNFYFTTADGIKKISAKTAADFTTAADFITDAGAVKALDVTGNLNPQVGGFLPANSKVAYRLVWGYKDANNVLLLGSPSSRLVITNYSSNSANVDLEFVIPSTINDNYFYQLYRTGIFTATGSLTLDDIDPGDEMQLILEDFPTAAQKSASLVTLTDITSDDFRQGGTYLYTNPNSGEGINQSNEPPPKAKDITLYSNTMFYSNTETRANTTVSLLGVGSLVSNTSSITIDDGVNPAQTYTFVGDKEETNIDFASYTPPTSIKVDADGKYWTLNSASNIRKYYVWYDSTITTQTLDFSGYIGTIPSDLDGDYIVIFTTSGRTYYVWFDATGTTEDPASTNINLSTYISVKVDISSGVTTKADLANAVYTALDANNLFNDYDLNYVALDEFLEIETDAIDLDTITEDQTVVQGFDYTIDTPLNNDPGDDLGTHTDLVGRVGFRVSVARNITTNAQLADATAAAILDQDVAVDFDVTYTSSNEYLDITTTNNGNVDDANDTTINPLGNGFSITVTTQGDGEDAASNHVLLSAAATPAQQIDETARSLVNIINKNNNDVVNAFYISGPSDIPGQILFEVRDIETSSFSVTASDASTGALFNPALPPATGASAVTGESEIKPNRLFYSKLQQPEAVPTVNFIDIGPEDQGISRILGLRESLFILKEDGIYRLTGTNGAFAVDSFDPSTKIIAPDSAVVLNNQIYCLTNQGIAVISDTGVDIISKRLDNIINQISSSNYNYEFTTFGISYETDRCYWLFVPSATTDTVATQAFRYNTAEDNWTRQVLSKTCGIVNSGDNKIYLGASDENFIERERKLFKRTDYADRDYTLSITPNAVEGTSITLSQSNIAETGDAIVQTQYLTVNQYNNLLQRLDLDPFIGEKEAFTVDFSSYTGSVPTDLHTKYFVLYSASDNRKYAVFYDAVGDLYNLDTSIYTDIADAEQIRINISSGVTTKADVASVTQNTIKTFTQDFVITYITSQELFTGITVNSGETTDISDGIVNGIGDGFSVSVTTQGFGDYYETQQAVPGDNLSDKLNSLATKLDADPSVNDTDYVTTVSAYPATFVGAQDAFNALINKLNLDTGVFYSNYTLSEGTTEFELLVTDYEPNRPDITVQYSVNFIEGPVTIFKGINSIVKYAPETFGDPSVLKQVSEGTFMFEDCTFTGAQIGYASDLSPGVEEIPFNKSGKGDFGQFLWSNQNWGGGYSGVPVRTYIPRSKQRCRYIQAYYNHYNSREKWAIVGFSYSVRGISNRAYRD